MSPGTRRAFETSGSFYRGQPISALEMAAHAPHSFAFTFFARITLSISTILSYFLGEISRLFEDYKSMPNQQLAPGKLKRFKFLVNVENSMFFNHKLFGSLGWSSYRRIGFLLIINFVKSPDASK